MKEIVKIFGEVYSNWAKRVYIESIDSFFYISSSSGIQYGKTKSEYDNCGRNNYKKFSKSELELFQNILLKGYVHSQITLEKHIEKKKSISELDIIKTNILCIRENLIEISTYIDTYDETLDEYREI